MRKYEEMSREKSFFGFTGIALGAAALLLAVLHFLAGPLTPKPALEEVVSDKVRSIKQAANEKLKGEKNEIQVNSSDIDTDQIVAIFYSTLAAIAVIFGVFGWAKNEPFREASGAVIMGGIAIIFQIISSFIFSFYFALIVFIIFLIFILYIISRS
jgi:hypothetical protein